MAMHQNEGSADQWKMFDGIRDILLPEVLGCFKIFEDLYFVGSVLTDFKHFG